jgi:hypothetical protein
VIYEYREYHVMPGKMRALRNRFAEITMKLFEKHGLSVIGFWEPAIGQNNLLMYILAFEDLTDRDRAWKAFGSDPDWQEAVRLSESEGPLVEKIVNQIWRPTSFSPLK